MDSHLTCRSTSSTAIRPDRVSDRVGATATRVKPSKTTRSAKASIRSAQRAQKPAGVTMDYQQGFTSGPSV